MTNNIYPGTSVEIVDGQLITPVSVPADSTLILDVAVQGPTGRLYFVTNAKDAATAFGATSPLIKQAQKAFDSGAKNVLLYRVGGASASLENLLSLGNGISTTSASAAADFGLSVYVGPEPLNPALDCIIVYRAGQVVYSNTLAAPVDLKVVSVDIFDKVTNTVAVGTFSNPVPFSLVASEAGVSSFVTATGVAPLTLPVGYDDTEVSTYSRIVKVNDLVLTPAQYTIDNVGLELTVTSPVLVPTDVVSYYYVTKYTPAEILASQLSYVTGEDLLNADYKTLYEAFDQALLDLEVVDAKFVVTGELFNVPNIAAGDTDPNRLEYLFTSEDLSGERTYEWSTSKLLYKQGITTTTDVSLADLTGNGQPIIVKRYNEVDFTHRIGMWAYEKTNEGLYPNVVIGVKGPLVYNTKYINLWVGSAPTYDLNGHIIANGTGLLGHRLLVGTTTYGGGYFATDTGFVDGTALTDGGGAAVDLGKYLSIVATQVVSNNQSIGSSITAGTAQYSGVASTVTPGDSTTNRVIPGVFVATELKETKLKALSNAGYVVFSTQNKGVTVISGDLATRDASDYQYLSTALTITQVVADLKSVGDPFIGRGIDGVSLVALQTALHKKMMERQTAGYFISYALQMQQAAPNEIRIAFTITAKDELRRISSSVKLARQTFTNINSVSGQ